MVPPHISSMQRFLLPILHCQLQGPREKYHVFNSMPCWPIMVRALTLLPGKVLELYSPQAKPHWRWTEPNRAAAAQEEPPSKCTEVYGEFSSGLIVRLLQSPEWEAGSGVCSFWVWCTHIFPVLLRLYTSYSPFSLTSLESVRVLLLICRISAFLGK